MPAHRALAGAMLLAVLAGCGGGEHAREVPPSVLPLATPLSFDVSSPVGLAVAAGRVWTVSAGNGTVSARTRPTGPALLTIRVGPTPLRAAYDGHLLWVSVFGAGRVVAIDPGAGRVVRRVRMPGEPEGIVAAFGSVWVVRQAARRLTEIRSDGTAGRSIRVGREPRLVAAGDRYLYVGNFGAGTVTRVDPRTGEARTSTALCTGPQGLAVIESVVWVSCTPDDSVISVDGDTLHLLGQVDVPGEPDAVRADDGQLYVATATGPALVKIGANPTSPGRDRTFPLGNAGPLLDQANVDAVHTAAGWWVSSPSDDKVYLYPD